MKSEGECGECGRRSELLVFSTGSSGADNQIQTQIRDHFQEPRMTEGLPPPAAHTHPNELVCVSNSQNALRVLWLKPPGDTSSRKPDSGSQEPANLRRVSDCVFASDRYSRHFTDFEVHFDW